MKKIGLLFLSVFCLCLFGCGSNDVRQGSYYSGGIDDSNIVRGPIFSNYKGCKARALDTKKNAYNGYVRCSRNCKDSKGGIVTCEEVVRSRHPLPGLGITFDEYDD